MLQHRMQCITERSWNGWVKAEFLFAREEDGGRHAATQNEKLFLEKSFF